MPGTLPDGFAMSMNKKNPCLTLGADILVKLTFSCDKSLKPYQSADSEIS